MPKYLFHTQGADSQGNIGPTRQRVQDKYLFDQEKKKILEPVVEAALPLGAYSGNAEGSVLPIDPRLMLRVKDLLSKGATERQIFDDLQAVKSGSQGAPQWNKFEPDMPKDLSTLFKQNKHGFQEYIGPAKMRLDQILGGKMTAPGSTSVNMRKDMPYNVRGEANVLTPHMDINVGRLEKSPDDYLGVAAHENQHIFDYGIGRSTGSNMNSIDPGYVNNLRSMLGDRYDVADHYLHNIGEVRARQNEMLNMQPENYNGLESVFTDSRPLRDQMIWGR